MQTAEIRRRFLEHFAQRGHTVVPSASLISPDPSLLFTVAGMVPFIPYLTGREPAPFDRAASVQKCVRTLDIEEVGKTTRHGTFFQMNGNFSFGDYFKEGAIAYAWELITNPVDQGGLGFDPERIWATVYLDDDEAADAWHRITGLPEERIQRLGMEDNYWSTGGPGPAGPCSEIHYDRGAEFGPDGGPLVDRAGDRFLEFWNLVFMQYERGAGEGKDFPILGELPKKNIDTGMGLERVAYLLQGVDNMYEIDEVAPVLHRAADLAGVRYGADHEADVRLRVVADHVRSGLMLIGDGVTPGNEGGGYILRRLLRRAVRSMKLLGVDEATLPELLPVSRDAMSASYPELATDFARISAIAYAEEEAFRRTLAAGTTLFDTAVKQAKAAGTPALSGDQAFSLHDTFGFPIDVTLEMAAEQGVTVDEAGFRALMKEQRERARADSRAKRTGAVDVLAYRRLLTDHGPTDWQAYDTLRTDSRVLGLVAEGDVDLEVAATGDITRVVLDRTPFYAESGGQVADAGVLTWDGGRAEVIDVQRPVKGLVAHQVRVTEGELREGTELTAEVDYEWRLSACQAHSGTHVVHAALRQVLGPQALQSGSYNRPGYLRLDFAWQGALSAQQRSDIEDVANAAVRADHRVTASYMTLPEAREFGALALFGETYGEQVRVVEIGGPWSRELCGGTHVRGSAQIGTLALTGESSVGSGSRRVEAVVGLEGFRYLARERDLVRQLAELLKAPQDGLVERVSGMLTRLRDADKELAELRSQQTQAAAGQLAASSRDVGGVALVTGSPAGLNGGDLRTLALDVRGRLPGDRPALVLLASEFGGKVALVAALNPAALEAGLSANDVLRAAAPPVGGRGGGKADVAQGGGTDPAGIPAALQAGEQAVLAATGR
ncbi:MAG: alanyl-tRNA synthetase [Blastococcus sp.]|jgi:alanyl-tRNA synthetase|nr:alanyl-tRNA synthetase [Blastococcus sp.]